MKQSLVILAALAVLVVVAGTDATAMSVAFDAGTTNYTTAIADYTTLGDDMVGMTVTAILSNQSTETVLWAAAGAGAGAASGTGWSLAESGNTYGGTWTLSNTGIAGTTVSGPAILGLRIDAGTGDTVFDITWSAPSTPNSESGWTIDSAADGVATYRDLVALSGQAPVGDLYRRLDILFPNGGIAAGNSITFIADTDNLKFSGDLNVPEPGTLALLGAGLLAVGGLVMRRRRRA